MRYKKVRKYHKLLGAQRELRRRSQGLIVALHWLWHKLKWVSPFRLIKIIDGYIIRKFIGTYFYSIILIISISIVFDVNENLAQCPIKGYCL